MKKQWRSHCPISFGLDVFGDRWSLLILRDIIFKEKKRYQEFLNSEEGISTNILADRLKLLEDHGIISKKDDPDNKKQILYAPTKKGLDLIPVMLEIIRWSGRYDLDTAVSREFIARLSNDLDGLIREVRSQFEKPQRLKKQRHKKESRK